MTSITTPILMRGTSCSSTNSINVLITFGRMLGEINARTEHTSDVSVPFVEALLDDGVDEGRSVKQHPLARLVAVFLGDFFSSMRVPLPQFFVLDFLDL